MYSQKVIEYFKNPHNQGTIEDATVVGEAGNPVCGDLMRLYLKIRSQEDKEWDKDIIEDIKFETLGCAAAIATSSMITDLAKGKTVKEAYQISKSSVASELEGLPPIKMHCSVLSVDALHNALQKYKELKTKIQDKSMRQQILEVLSSLRPTMQMDGGDVELVDVDEGQGVVKIRLIGACSHCLFSDLTLKEGIEKSLKEKVPGVKEVVAVDEGNT